MTNEQQMYQLIRKHETLTRIFNRAMAARDFDMAQVFSGKLDTLDDQIARRRETQRHFEVASRKALLSHPLATLTTQQTRSNMQNDHYTRLDLKNDASLTEVDVQGQSFVLKLHPKTGTAWGQQEDRWTAFTAGGKYIVDGNGASVSFHSKQEMLDYLAALAA